MTYGGYTTLNFTYDPMAGYLELGGYVVYASTETTNPCFDDLHSGWWGDRLPTAYPLVCIVTLDLKLYCQANGGAYTRFFLIDLLSDGNLELALGDGGGIYVAAVDLFLQSA